MIPLAPAQKAPVGPSLNNTRPGLAAAGPIGAPRPQMAPASQAAPVGAPPAQDAPVGQAQYAGMPRPQTMPLAQPIGAPAPQTGIMGQLQAGGGVNASQSIPLAAGSQNYANVSPIAPGGATDYTNKTITPGAGVDRLALAKSNFQNFKDSTEPEYQAALREAGQSGAAAGQIGSGMLRGRLGDIGLARTRDLQSAETQNLNDATEGSIGDEYKNIGIAQQQQGYQAGRQDTAFGQGVTQAELNDNLTNSDFNRNATRLSLGDSGNPSDVGLALSGYYGNQAGQSGAAAADLLKSSYLNKALTPKAA